MSVTRSHSLSIGIVGLPNSGKSTLFNSLTKKAVPAENFPFCTIDKNVGIVEVPDPRLASLSEFFKAEKVVPSAIQFTDIAGLVKGASKGEGLGNQFLSHIREVNAVMYVIRAFSSPTISHVYERIDPLEDFKIVQSELILKDLETVEKKLHEVNKRARVGADKESIILKAALDGLMESLGEGIPAIDFKVTDAVVEEEFKNLWLLTNKPRIFLLNVQEGADEQLRSDWKSKVMEYLGEDHKDFILEVDVKMIGQLSEMTEEERAEYLSLLPTEPVLIDEIIRKGFERLELITFYTGSSAECNAWSIRSGANIKEAAGVIHTDLSDNFVAADVANVMDIVEKGGINGVREAGLFRSQGRDYLVRDGDYVLIHVTKG